MNENNSGGYNKLLPLYLSFADMVKMDYLGRLDFARMNSLGEKDRSFLLPHQKRRKRKAKMAKLAKKKNRSKK